MAQTFKTHRRFVPGYHFVASPLLLAYLVFRAIAVFRNPGAETGWELVGAIGLFLIAFYSRVFPLGVQDRLIRLEERLRMHQLLPDDLQSRIDDLSARQMVALRFVPDGELPDLARRVLDERITDPEAIKKLITTWRPDETRI